MSDPITMTIHHGGKFEYIPQLIYVGGKEAFFKNLHPNDVSYWEIMNMVDELGYNDVSKIFYKVPGTENKLDESLVILFNDEVTFESLSRLLQMGHIEIYIENKSQNMFVNDEHAMSQEMEDELNSKYGKHNARFGTDDGKYGESDAYGDIDVDIGSESDCLEEDQLDSDDEDLNEVRKKVRDFKENIHKKFEACMDSFATIDVQLHDKSNPKGYMDESLAEEGYASEYFDSPDDYSPISGSDDDDERGRVRSIRQFPRYNANVKDLKSMFQVSMIFADAKEFKNVVTRDEKTFQVKSYKNEHMCTTKHKIQWVTSEWLAKTYFDKIKRTPDWKLMDFKQQVKEDYKIMVTETQCCRARKKALLGVEGAFKAQFTRLRDYANELLRSNPNNTVKIDTYGISSESTAIFRKIYICLDSLKKGFKQGCRPIIGLDGCFLKGFAKGELLSAIGRDGNNQMFPIAWALVEVENKDSWNWFLKLLLADLDIGNGFGYTFISDQQKGLLPAIAELMPQVEHMHCARHIYRNWKKKHKGEEYRTLFWKAAKSFNHADFNKHMDELKSLDVDAHKDLVKTHPKHWCRAFFSETVKCEIVDNNLCETFNGYIIEPRSKPVVPMLEDIRTTLMVGSFDRFIVDLDKRICSCNEWSITGILYSHAISAIYYNKELPESYTSHWFKKETYLKAYEFMLEPLNGERLWPKSNLGALEAPLKKRLPGRPKKLRRRESFEPKNSTRMSKKGVKIKCRKCSHEGHNRRRCPFNGNPPPNSSNLPIKRKSNPIEGFGVYTSTRPGETYINMGTTSKGSRLAKSTTCNLKEISRPRSKDHPNQQDSIIAKSDNLRPANYQWKGNSCISSYSLMEKRNEMARKKSTATEAHSSLKFAHMPSNVERLGQK